MRQIKPAPVRSGSALGDRRGIPMLITLGVRGRAGQGSCRQRGAFIGQPVTFANLLLNRAFGSGLPHQAKLQRAA